MSCSKYIYKQNKDAVVHLEVVFKDYDSWWNSNATFTISLSGFFISADGYIVTNAHGILHPDIRYYISGGQFAGFVKNLAIFASVTNFNGSGGNKVVDDIYHQTLKVVGISGLMDIAVLKVEGLTNQSYIKWGNSRSTKIGSDCYILGSPVGKDKQSITAGNVSDNMGSFGRSYYSHEALWYNAVTYGGNSGGPIMNCKGDAIGVVSMGRGDTVGFGVPQYVAEKVVGKIIQSQSDYNSVITNIVLQSNTGNSNNGGNGGSVYTPSYYLPSNDFGILADDIGMTMRRWFRTGKYSNNLKPADCIRSIGGIPLYNTEKYRDNPISKIRFMNDGDELDVVYRRLGVEYTEKIKLETIKPINDHYINNDEVAISRKIKKNSIKSEDTPKGIVQLMKKINLKEVCVYDLNKFIKKSEDLFKKVDLKIKIEKKEKKEKIEKKIKIKKNIDKPKTITYLKDFLKSK